MVATNVCGIVSSFSLDPITFDLVRPHTIFNVLYPNFCLFRRSLEVSVYRSPTRQKQNI